MPPRLPYSELADAVLVLHFGVVLFVVVGLPVVIVGNYAGWGWVNWLWLRLAHLVAIATVVLQAWLGEYCALTELESWLRHNAGEARYERSFIEYWVQRALYYEAPLWVFAMAYTAFGLLVVWAWVRYPPKSGRARRRQSGA
jgi:hypothetical protein